MLPDAVVAGAECRDLRQVGDADDLVPLGNLTEFAADNRGCNTADAAVDFIEDHGRDVIIIADDLLEGQHDAGHFTAGCDFAQRFERFTAVGGNQELDDVRSFR